MSNETKAESIVYNAYQMYFGKPRENASKPFPMFSHDNPGNLFWEGFCEQLLDMGATEEQVEKILRSKHMRWMFDAESDKVVEFGKTFAEQYMIDWAKEN